MLRACLLRSAAYAVVLCIPMLAEAQEQSSGSAASVSPEAASSSAPVTVGEIIVTAQKRQERLSDVPLTITAVSGDQLQRQGITSTDQLERVVPGFSVTQSSFGTPVYTLRGVGFYDTSIGSSPAVAVYMDQVPIPYSTEARGTAFDLERVEVLNGPQGTLFGENSTGGAINYIAAKPTRDLTAGLQVDYGRFNEANAEGYVSSSLAPDLTFRLAARTENRDDWQEGYGPNDSRFGQSGATLGARRFNEARLLLDWRPTGKLNFEVNLNGWHDGSDTQAQQFLAFSPASPQNAFNAGTYAAFAGLTTLPQNDRLAGFTEGQDYGRDDYFYQGSLRADYDLDAHVKLTSITAYSGYQENSLVDEDGTAILNQQTDRHAQIHSLSEEDRAALVYGPARLTAGLNYEDDVTDDNLINTLHTTNAGIGPLRYDGLTEIDRQRVKTYAAFASLDYKLTDQLSATVAGRYTAQDRDFAGCVADDGDGTLAAAFAGAFHVPAQRGGCVTLAAPGSTVLPPIITNKLDQNNVSWKGGLNWKPSPDLLLYANITKGYKSGSFPIIPGAVAAQFTPVTQESVLAYEGGFKQEFAQRRVSIDAAGFYYDYTNKQLLGYIVEAPFGKLPTLVNIPKSRIYGAEIQATIQLIEGLHASAGLTYVNSRVDQNPINPTDPFGHTVSFVGEAFPDTPELTAITNAEYHLPIPSSFDVYVGGGTESRSNTVSAFGGAPILKIRPYTLADLRAGFAPKAGPWSVEVWGRNITNQYYVTNVIHGADAVVAYAGMPRTYGITLKYRYR